MMMIRAERRCARECVLERRQARGAQAGGAVAVHVCATSFTLRYDGVYAVR